MQAAKTKCPKKPANTVKEIREAKVSQEGR